VDQRSKKLLAPLRNLTQSDLEKYYPNIADRLMTGKQAEKWLEEIYPKELRGFSVFYIAEEYFSWSNIQRNKLELFSKEKDVHVCKYLYSIQKIESDKWARTNTKMRNIASELTKYEDRNYYGFDDEKLEIIRDFCFREWLPLTRGCNVLSFEECILLVDMTKSPGRPWTDAPYFFKTKGEMWVKLGLAPHIQLRDDLYNSIFTVYPKNMVAEKEKIINKKYRSFCVAPFPYHLNMMRFCCEFNHRIALNPEDQPMFIGFNEFDGGWHSWQMKKKKFKKCYCFDISKCDSTVIELFYYIEFLLRWESLRKEDQTDENYKIMWFLWWDMWYCYLWYGGFILRKRGGNASGTTNTIETNCVHVFCLFVLAYLHWCKDYNDNKYSYEEFKEHFEIVICGDDCIFYTDLDVKIILNYMTLYGIQLKVESYEPREWKDNTFCSRTTINTKYKGRNLMVATLKKDKIFASWCYGTKNISIQLSYVRTCQLMIQAIWYDDLFQMMEDYLIWIVRNSNIQTAPSDCLGYDWKIIKTVGKSVSEILELYHGF